MLYEKINELVGFDTVEVFGNSGTGKTTFALEVIKAFQRKKKKILLIDTEKNLLKAPEGIDYEYRPSFDEVYSFLINPNAKLSGITDNIEKAIALKKGYDLVVLDSMGLPILGKFALMDMKNRGEILLACEAISQVLKYYCHKNDAIALVTNQPVSDFGKSIYHIAYPFGDKSAYFYKEIWKTRTVHSAPEYTEIAIDSFRSRKYGRKTPLFAMMINSKGTRVEAKI